MSSAPKSATLLPTIRYPKRVDELSEHGQWVIARGRGFDFAIDLGRGDPDGDYVACLLASEDDCGGRALLHYARELTPFDRLVTDPAAAVPVSSCDLDRLEILVDSLEAAGEPGLPQSVLRSVRAKAKHYRANHRSARNLFLMLRWSSTRFEVCEADHPALCPQSELTAQ